CLLALLVAPLTLACNQGFMIVHPCRIRGSIVATDLRRDVHCTIRLEGQESSDSGSRALSGNSFEHILSMAFVVGGPRQSALRDRLLVACDGYRTQASRELLIEPGFFTCASTDVGAVAVTPLPAGSGAKPTANR